MEEGFDHIWSSLKYFLRLIWRGLLVEGWKLQKIHMLMGICMVAIVSENAERTDHNAVGQCPTVKF